MPLPAASAISPATGSRMGLGLCLQSFLYGFACLFVARLIEQGKHILLVGLYTRLVEWVYLHEQTADATGFLEEVYHLSEVVLVQCGYNHAHVGHATIDMSQTGAQLGHLVHLVDALTC